MPQLPTAGYHLPALRGMQLFYKPAHTCGLPPVPEHTMPSDSPLTSPTATLDILLLLPLLGVALWLRPWRMLASRKPLVTQTVGDASPLWTPLLATLTFLPWLWALPTLHHTPLQLPWSGACLTLLMLGWPLAVLVLCAAGMLAWAIAPELGASQALSLIIWNGLIPATLALLWGGLLRRVLGTRVFVYIFGRGFVGTVLCLFATALLSEAAGHTLPSVHSDLDTIARWLMAWGDAVITGMMSAVFVAYRPQWLATWSDDLYLYGKPPAHKR